MKPRRRRKLSRQQLVTRLLLLSATSATASGMAEALHLPREISVVCGSLAALATAYVNVLVNAAPLVPPPKEQ